MQVQINAPHGEFPDTLIELIEREIEERLAKHASRLTRVEVHLQDLNAHKGGIDKRCLLEARPRGMDPVAADHESAQVADAFKGALDKLHRILDRRFGKLSSRGHGA